jgi:hypothetical protein
MLKKLMQKLNRLGVGSLHVLNTKIFKKAYSNVGKPTKCAIQQHSTAQHREPDASRCSLHHRSPTWIITPNMYLLSASSTIIYFTAYTTTSTV